ncbi:response regulator [bacterium]|nr:response regulator [bacterium]
MELKKILIVEDSTLLHKMYDLLLGIYKRKGTKLIYALNGQDGLDQLQQNGDVGLILLDINMPTMNGLQFLGIIRKDPDYERIPVIIISTEGKEEDTVRGLSLGADAYIAKPFQGPQLRTLIDQLIGNGDRS